MVSQAVVDALRRFRSAEPFRPFELIFRDGQRAQIIWPDAVGWHALDDELSYAAPDDSFIHMPLSNVTEVRLLDNLENGNTTTP
jgi:hypothetical protein